MRSGMIDPKILVALARALVVAPRVSQAHAKQAGTPASAVKLSPELASARDALAKYADPMVAVRDGYFSTVACVDFPHGAKDGPVEYPPGAMGVHFLNPAHVGPTLDPAKPQVLLYEQVDGKLKLTGAEWFVPAALVGDKPAPAIFGQTLAGPMDGHEPIMPASLRHYDLHVWLWKDNPRGLFTSTNAAVKCDPKAPYTSLHH